MASAQTSNAQRVGCCLFWGFPKNTPIQSNVWVNVIEILNCLKFLPPPSPTHKLKCFCQICEKLSLCYPNFSATWSHRSITRGKNRVKSLHRTNPQTIQQLSFHSVISLNIYLFRSTVYGIDKRDCELLYQTDEVEILVFFSRLGNRWIMSDSFLSQTKTSLRWLIYDWLRGGWPFPLYRWRLLAGAQLMQPWDQLGTNQRS